MAWERVVLEDQFCRDGKPFIAISRSRVSYSASFARLADIDEYYRVSISADPETYRLGFFFHKDERLDSLALTPDHKCTNKKTGLFSSSHSLVSRYKWINRVTQLTPKERRFSPQKSGNSWILNLCPTFEHKFNRFSSEIPKEINGVYRYMLSNGEVVYIGRGNIYKRLKCDERSNWVFDLVEYTILNDKALQILWESYYINRYFSQNGVLPAYNKICGFAKTGNHLASDVEDNHVR